MHLALPKKRISIAPTYNTRSSRYRLFRRNKIQSIALSILALVLIICIFSQVFGSSSRIRYGSPSVVIVTILDHEKYNKDYTEDIKQNRINYAKKHGYLTFFPNITDYDLAGAPRSWAQVPAVRHAISKFDQCEYVWYLDHNSLIMNPAIKLYEDIMSPMKIESVMLASQPIVPPNSVIRTFQDLKGTNVELVLTQDSYGLVPNSLIIRRGCWSKFFLDVWFDPLYRSYNFQKAQIHALEHIVQWHPTILSKVALIPQKMLNSYTKQEITIEKETYEEGDFVVELLGCQQTGRNCASEAQPYLDRSKRNFT